MSCRSLLRSVSFLTACALVCLALGPTAGFGSEPDLQVLFLGNSYTHIPSTSGRDYANQMTEMLAAMGASAAPPVQIEVTFRAPGGCTLERHGRDAESLELVRRDDWDAVVLQEQSLRPVEDPEAMKDGAGVLAREVERIGARLVFFMTWARRDRPAMIEDLARTYEDVASSLGADLAPVGRAWQAALDRRPDLMLHHPDGSHPSSAGAYLTACVFYVVLTGKSPVGLSDGGIADLDDDAARFLQSIAWETVGARRAQD